MPSLKRMTLVLMFLIGVLLLLEVLYAVAIFTLPGGLAGTDFDPDAMAHLASFGESFGGINAFFTAIGFAGIATTIFIQHRVSQTQTEDLKEQLGLLTDSTKAQERLTKSQIYQNSKMTFHDLTKYFIHHPEDKPYFYSGWDFPKEDPDFTRLYTLAELFVDGVDEMLVNMETYPNAAEWKQWKTFFSHIYRSSPIVRRYLEDNHNWYDPDLNKTLTGFGP